MAGIKSRKLKASTLIESLIAMVLIMVCFGVATTIYVQVMRDNNSRQRMHAHLILQRQLSEAGPENLQDHHMKSGSMLIVEKVISYNNISGLQEVVLTAYDREQHFLDRVKKIICMDDQNRVGSLP